MIPTAVPVECTSYRAIAVLQQSGSDNRGHCVTVVRQGPEPESSWWLCNDSIISTVPRDCVTQDAVAILYRRVPSAP